ncbi:MAG: sulfatase-like hydrolase/transferase [Lentisphaeria bacterium]|nr:sulfatase-like hydrolase/transferase [Lentisphaeria bacterium]
MPKENFIFIIADQMRSDCMGCMGNPNVKTPNMDKLAAAGVIFENHYAQSPVCLPSRVSIYTGKYPRNNGSIANLVGQQASEKSFVEDLADMGYRTVSHGSNHMQPEPWGYQHLEFCASGSDTYLDFLKHEGEYENSLKSPTHKNEDLRNYEYGMYHIPAECSPDLYNAAGATKFIENHSQEEPFFLWLGFFLPHPHYATYAPFNELYDPDEIELFPGLSENGKLHPYLQRQKDAGAHPDVSEQVLREITAAYYANISLIDEGLGRVIRALEEKGSFDNTHIIFTADHGDFTGTNGVLNKGSIPAEKLVHVPMIWKPVKKKNSPHGIRVSSYTEHVDLAPTILDLATSDQARRCEGKSMASFLTGDTDLDKRDSAYSEICHVLYDDKSQAYDWELQSYFSSLFMDDWHYLHSLTEGDCALYNMRDDRQEQFNRIADPECRDIYLQMKDALLNRILSNNRPAQGHDFSSWTQRNEHLSTLESS